MRPSSVAFFEAGRIAGYWSVHRSLAKDGLNLSVNDVASADRGLQAINGVKMKFSRFMFPSPMRLCVGIGVLTSAHAEDLANNENASDPDPSFSPRIVPSARDCAPGFGAPVWSGPARA